MVMLLCGIALAALGIRVFLGLMGIIGRISVFLIGVFVLAAFAAVIGLVFKLICAAVPVLLLAAACYFVYKLADNKLTA